MTKLKLEGHNTIMNACDEWCTRPADQRFASLEDLHARVLHAKDTATEATGVDLSTLRITHRDNEPLLLSPRTGKEAHFTNNAFKQFASRVGAPASYLTTLPANLVEDNLNHGLSRLKDTQDNLLFSVNGVRRLRSVTSGSYQRIWNADITSRLLRLVQEQPQWQPAPAAFDGSRGLYASDEDMFAFLVDNDRRIFERGPAGGLSRGFFVSNSEVVGKAFRLTTFFYEYVCGNHRIWGASDITEVRIPHIGDADDRAFGNMAIELTKYASASAKDDEARVKRAQLHVLGADKDAVLDALFGMRIAGVGRKVLEQSYDVAVQHEDWYGAPNTAWGITGGMTQVARDLPNASDRVALERASSKILSLASGT